MAAQGGEGLAGGEAGKATIYSVELDMFEGPLDLLLHLVRRHELDILDIPISFVAEKYLEYLHLMRSLDLEVAGDYLVMAATLAWLKSRELLPPEPREGEAAGADDEEGEDPREALIRRLVEYERFKNAAAELDAMPVSGRDVFARGADIDVPPLDPGLAPVTLFRLAEAYYRVLTRAKIKKTHDVTIEAVTVAQRMKQLTLMLDERQEFDFEGLFLGRTWSSEPELRAMLVVTLMSVLELVKLGVARVQQVPESDAIRVYRLAASEEARKLIASYDEDASFGAPAEPPAPQGPTEAELDAIEERALLAEALAGLAGPEDDEAGPGELGVLAEELDPETLQGEPDVDGVLADEADLGPEAIAAAAANSDPTEAGEGRDADLSDATGAFAGDDAKHDLTEAAPEPAQPSSAAEAPSSLDLSDAPGVSPATDAEPEAPASRDLSEAPGASPATDAEPEAPSSFDPSDASGPAPATEAAPDAPSSVDLSEAPGPSPATEAEPEAPSSFDPSDAPGPSPAIDAEPAVPSSFDLSDAPGPSPATEAEPESAESLDLSEAPGSSPATEAEPEAAQPLDLSEAPGSSPATEAEPEAAEPLDLSEAPALPAASDAGPAAADEAPRGRERPWERDPGDLSEATGPTAASDDERRAADDAGEDASGADPAAAIEDDEETP